MQRGNAGEEILSPTIKEIEELHKEVKVQDTGRQLVLPLPALFVQLTKIKRGDIFIFHSSLNGKEYSITLKQNEKNKKKARSN